MKKIIPLLIIVLSFSSSFGQQLVKLRLAPLDESIYPVNSNIPQLRSNSNQEIITVMGGLNDLDGMNNYFNIYGSKLIIQDKNIASDGITHIVLRREDGKNFYGIYPTMKAEIIPLENTNSNPLAMKIDGD